MTVQNFSATNFRNFPIINVECGNDFNLLYGLNGAGKTNFLEGLYYLGTGRSFRCHLFQRLIMQKAENFLLCGTIRHHDNTVNIGIQRFLQGKYELHINGEKTSSFAELARYLPIQILNQDSYQILTGGPKRRRQFIDWGVFHVEHAPVSLWSRYERALYQRNSAIRHKKPETEIKLWDKELAINALSLHEARQVYLDKLLPLILNYCAALFKNTAINIDYYAGWDQSEDLENVLDKTLARDLKVGFTCAGPHRADLRFHSNETPVQDLLSRGQQKLFLLALYAAQGTLLNQATQNRFIFLIDDLVAELDPDKQNIATLLLTELEAQIFITGIEVEHLLITLSPIKKRAIQTFHVEQNNIRVT